MLTSLLVYKATNSFLSTDMFREILYSIAPMVFYFIARRFNVIEVKAFSMVLILGVCFVILFGILYQFKIPMPEVLMNALDKKGKANFISYYSPISMGYVAQLMFALILFKQYCIKKGRIILLIFFFTISFLTLQRAAILGVFIAVFIKILFLIRIKISGKLLF